MSETNEESLVVNDMTQVNSSRGNNKMVTMAGFGFIAVAGLCIAYLGSSDNSTLPKKQKEESEIRNTLPTVNYTEAQATENAALQTPAPVTTPPLSPTPLPAIQQAPADPNAKPKLSPWERKRNGGIIAASGETSATPGSATAAQPQTGNAALAALAQMQEAQNAKTTTSPEETGLASNLKPTKIAGVSAAALPNRNFLLTKGSTLDCILKTALDSSLSGLATCQITRDIYSTDGKVVLLDKGSLITGEYQGGMKMGQNRLFLLWNRVETPSGIIIDINSPSIDPIGRAGVDGWVDNHFADRFATAILVSLLQTASQAGGAYLQGLASSSTGSNSTTNISSVPQAGTEIVKSMLQNSANISPTLNKNQGDHIQVMIARDLDFSTIYSLKGVS